MDENFIDADDVSDRVYFHMIVTSYVLILLLIEALIVILHSIASLYFVNFQISNPICVLVALGLGWTVYKQVSTRYLQRELMKLLSTTVLIALVLPFVITSENVKDFIENLLDVSQFSLIVTMILLVLLLLALM